MEDKYCTVLDKLDSKVVLFVTKNCLSTVVGNPQRKVTVFVPAGGFKDTDHFKAHVCGGEWDHEKLKNYAETDSAFLVSKGGAENGKRYKYAVTMSGKSVTVGGVKLKDPAFVTRNGVVYNLGAGDVLDTSIVDDTEYVPRERKGPRGSRKGVSKQAGGRDVINHAAVVKDLIGQELRNYIISCYQNYLPVVRYPIVGGNGGISWPNSLFADFCNYIVATPTYGFGYLQDLSPLIGDNYWANVNAIFQPNDLDLVAYGVADEVFRGFTLSDWYCYTDPLASINAAYNILSGLNITITRGGTAPREVVFGGMFGLLGLGVKPIALESGYDKIEKALGDYVNFEIDKIKALGNDAYARYIIECIVNAVYGYDGTNDTFDVKDEVPYIGHKTTSGFVDIFYTCINNAKDKNLLTVFNYNASKTITNKKQRFAILLMAMSLARYLRRDDKTDRFKHLPMYNISGDSLGHDMFRGVVGSANFELKNTDVYTDLNKPRSDYNLAAAITVPSLVFSPLSTMPFISMPNYYLLVEPNHKNCFTACMFKLFIEIMKAAFGTDLLFTTPKVYTTCKLSGINVYPVLFNVMLFPQIDREVIGMRGNYYSSYAPRALYDDFAKHCWTEMKGVKSTDSVLQTICDILGRYFMKIDTDYVKYVNKTEVMSDSPLWYIRWNSPVASKGGADGDEEEITADLNHNAAQISDNGHNIIPTNLIDNFRDAQMSMFRKPTRKVTAELTAYQNSLKSIVDYLINNKNYKIVESCDGKTPPQCFSLKNINTGDTAYVMNRAGPGGPTPPVTKTDSLEPYTKIFEAAAKKEKTESSNPCDIVLYYVNKYNLAHCLYRATNVLEYLHNNGFTQMVAAIRAFEGADAMPKPGQIRHEHSPGFLYEPQAYNNVINSARMTFSQKFHSTLNKTFAGGAETVLEIYESAHSNNTMFLMNNYMALKPFHPRVATTMFYSDFMKFVGAKQGGGGSTTVMTDIYKNMFPGNIALAVKNFMNPAVYPDLDFGVIDAFVRSEYFLCNTGNLMYRAPRSLTDTSNPRDTITSNLLD
jgi:hypothetical protein